MTRSVGRRAATTTATAQDNEISWFDWEHADTDLLDFTRRLIPFRLEHPVFRRRRWFQDRPIHGDEVHDIEWFAPDGTGMGDDHWHDPLDQALGIFLSRDGLDDIGRPTVGDHSYYLAINADARSAFRAAEGERGQRWRTAWTRRPTQPSRRVVALPCRAGPRAGPLHQGPARTRGVTRPAKGAARRRGRRTSGRPAPPIGCSCAPAFGFRAAAAVAAYL